MSEIASKKRVTLTAKALETQAAQDLRILLLRISSDGRVDNNEIQELRAWLKENHNSDLPAVMHLSAIVEYICLDGKIDNEERLELQVAIEKVLPKDDREKAKERRKEVEPATEAQIGYIEILGGKCEPGLTKQNAATLITALKERQQVQRREEAITRNAPSNRQRMVLRFWGKSDLGMTRYSVSDWMDAFYRQDEDHLKAWELWKSESGDDGSQREPESVAWGLGSSYLKRIKQGAVDRQPDDPYFGVKVIAFASSILVLIIAISSCSS